jgi:uncharacterized protein
MPNFSLLPKEGKFFKLFEESAQNAVDTAVKLNELMQNWDHAEDKVAVITDLEHKGDNIRHQIVTELHRTFVTPFDREDINALSEALDDVIDFIQSAADFMLLYHVEEPTQRAKELAAVIVEITAEVQKAVGQLKKHIDQREMLKYCVEINRMENVADRIFRSAVSELFANTKDMSLIIKWREIYEHMETVTDRCEDVANVLEGVAVKYS